MSDKYKLRCRVDSCMNIRVFHSLKHAKASEWTEISPMGMVKDNANVHQAFCPAHSMDL